MCIYPMQSRGAISVNVIYKANKTAPTATIINNMDSSAFYSAERTIIITDGSDISGIGCGIQFAEYHIDTGDASALTGEDIENPIKNIVMSNGVLLAAAQIVTLYVLNRCF